ncbi:MAG: methyltransferase [Ignavibacteriaceae bacterium]|nr:methyltransferase [Ignavibacteriaceae bacterium]
MSLFKISAMSYILVILQIFFSGYIVLTNFRYALNFPWYFLIIVSSIPGIAGMVQMKSKLRMLPEPASDAVLLQDGIYKFIRHPMYLSVLLTTLVITLLNINLFEVTAWLLLLITIIIKLNREESFLKEKFAEYTIYRNRTKALIPFII